MPDYRRAYVPGGTYFFTVNTYGRGAFLLDEPVRRALREGIRCARDELPFAIEAWVLLPDHLHCIWTLPPGDADFSKRWAIIKRTVSKRCGDRIEPVVPMSESRRQRKEAAIWQRRFWEHQIRDERDFAIHVDYIHYNPVKHRYATKVRDWTYSTFHRYVKTGIYTNDWGGNDKSSEGEGFGE